jgi:hypothetical protein
LNGFDASKKLIEQYQPSVSTSAYVHGVIASAKNDLLTELQHWQPADPAGFDQQFLNRAVFSVTAFGVDGTGTRVANGSLTLIRDEGGMLHLNEAYVSCPEQCSKTGYLLSGMYEAIEPMLKKNSSLLTPRHPSNMVRLLEIEASAQPHFVGGPPSQVAIDDSGVVWLEQGACSQESSSLRISN